MKVRSSNTHIFLGFQLKHISSGKNWEAKTYQFLPLVMLCILDLYFPIEFLHNDICCECGNGYPETGE
jgi:hypothetical protein